MSNQKKEKKKREHKAINISEIKHLVYIQNLSFWWIPNSQIPLFHKKI